MPMHVIEDMGTTLKIAGECPFCGHVRHIVVKTDDFCAWENGTLIQRAFPKLNSSDRELLMTGICDDCFPK